VRLPPHSLQSSAAEQPAHRASPRARGKSGWLEPGTSDERKGAGLEPDFCFPVYFSPVQKHTNNPEKYSLENTAMSKARGNPFQYI